MHARARGKAPKIGNRILRLGALSYVGGGQFFEFHGSMSGTRRPQFKGPISTYAPRPPPPNPGREPDRSNLGTN